MYMCLEILRLRYVPGSPGSPVCSKRSVPWNFCHYIVLCFQDLVKFSYRSVTISVTSRGSDKAVCHGGAMVRYGYPQSITINCTLYYGLLRSYAIICVLIKA